MGGLRVLSVIVALGALATEAAAAPVNVAYCQQYSRHASSYFAARERSNGKLDFSLSVWRSGRFAGLAGVAAREGDHCVYRSKNSALRPGRLCVAVVRFRADGGAQITPQPLDACDGGQGAGASIDDVTFAPSALAGVAPKGVNVEEARLGPKCDFPVASVPADQEVLVELRAGQLASGQAL